MKKNKKYTLDAKDIFCWCFLSIYVKKVVCFGCVFDTARGYDNNLLVNNDQMQEQFYGIIFLWLDIIILIKFCMLFAYAVDL